MGPDRITSFRGEYDFLSNFYPCTIRYEEQVFDSVEHAYQAAKSPSLSRRHDFTVHARTPLTAAQAKRLGRTLELRHNWDELKDSVMLDLLRLKFAHEALGTKLLNTGLVVLVEENTWNDTYWGVCHGTGKNQLGRLLMRVREEVWRKRLPMAIKERIRRQEG
jgi:ribA/ribD-fused uncharacterized protein